MAIRTTPVVRVEAERIRAAAERNSVIVTARGGTVTARKTFTPGDHAAYVEAEHACQEILDLFRQTRLGSTWGTTSDSVVGGHTGLVGGSYRLSKSGVEARLARQFTQQAV